MVGIKIDGNEIAKSVINRVTHAVVQLKSQGTNPCLATILVGDDQASATYIKNKHKACKKAGIETRDHRLAASATQDQISAVVDKLNEDKTVHGILIQIPLPNHIDEFAVTSRISPLKDVDGLTPHNTGLLHLKKAVLVACTPSGVMEILDYHKIDMQGKNVVLINRSNLVGRPLYHLLLQRDSTVTTCHSKTRDLVAFCKNADIIITAVGDRTRFILTADMIKKDAVVIDVAISRLDGKLVGDADFDKIIQKASFATPVPGGVGPMTVAMLLKNTITAASLVNSIEK